MRGSFRYLPLLLALCVCVLASACGSAVTAPPAETAAPGADSEPAAVPPYDVPGEEMDAEKPVETGAQTVTDGLEGDYYNDYLHLTLTLDGSGGCVMAGAAGSYTAADGALTLDFDGRQESAVIDGDGDITIAGRTGYFLRDWDFWGITEAETGGNAVRSVRTGVSDNGDGTYRLRDFENAIAVTYPSGMTADRDAVLSGVAIGNGSGAFVTGRNVTELYSTHSGTDDEFLSDYLRSFVFADSAALYGSMEGYAELTLLHEGIEGRLAAATVTLQCGGNNVYAKAILYTSTYNDGTVNYVCKTVFAADAAEADDVAAAVTNMGAVRLRADA